MAFTQRFALFFQVNCYAVSSKRIRRVFVRRKTTSFIFRQREIKRSSAWIDCSTSSPARVSSSRVTITNGIRRVSASDSYPTLKRTKSVPCSSRWTWTSPSTRTPCKTIITTACKPISPDVSNSWDWPKVFTLTSTHKWNTGQFESLQRRESFSSRIFLLLL